MPRAAGSEGGCAAGSLGAAVDAGGDGYGGPLLLELRDQRQQRIHRLRRIHVQHQAVRILAHRPQRECLGVRLGLEVQNQAGDAGPVASDPCFADKGVVRADPGGERLEHAGGIDVF